MKNIEDFVNKLIEDRGFNEQDPEVIYQMKSDLMERVENRINAMILENINPEKLENFNNILNSDSEEEIQNFVKNEIPNIDEKIAKELLEFKNIYLG